MDARRTLILALVSVLAGSPAVASPGQATPDASAIRAMVRTAATRHQVPPEALFAVTLAETGRLTGGIFQPWPWSLNVGGKSYFYASRQEACRALTGFMRTRGLKSIDAGIAQTNLGWHGHRFITSCDALDPARNLDAAARILRECYQVHRGSWLDAAACYHHPRGGPHARRYRATVQKHIARLARLPQPGLLTDIPARPGKETL